VGEGAPSQKTCRAAAQTEPLAEGGFVLRRSLAVLASLAAALAATFVMVPFAAAAVVHIRVEGKTRTIYGASQPRISSANPLEALLAAARAGEFYAHVASSSFGNYVDQIGFYPAAGSAGWVFKVDGASPPVGADQVELKDGDVVLWYWATFGASGGPPTLSLTKVQGRCYRVVEQDDAGKTSAAVGAVLHVDGRIIRTQGATGAAVACLTGRHGPVWATLAGAVRSNRVP
jgi:hypothetical protein